MDMVVKKCSVFGSFVFGILLWCSGVEMGGLDAAAPIAHVQYWCVWGNRSSTDFVRGSVRKDLAAVLRGDSIATLVESVSPDQAGTIHGC